MFFIFIILLRDFVTNYIKIYLFLFIFYCMMLYTYTCMSCMYDHINLFMILFFIIFKKLYKFFDGVLIRGAVKRANCCWSCSHSV